MKSKIIVLIMFVGRGKISLQGDKQLLRGIYRGFKQAEVRVTRNQRTILLNVAFDRSIG